MKKLEDIDKNFEVSHIQADDIVFYNCLSKPFAMEGLFPPTETGHFHRLPEHLSKCDNISGGVKILMYHTAGGIIRFVTDSPYIGFIAEVNGTGAMQHITDACQFGFDMYTANASDRKKTIYTKSFLPPRNLSTENLNYDGFYQFHDNRLREIVINFPTYTTVNKVLIGLKEGCVLQKPEPYTIKNPVVFYGSSVTQGCSASRPGTVYTFLLSRWLDFDYRNLDFSGSDRGEPALAEYIAIIPMSAFVYAYGFNAPTLEHYENTHYPFYKIIREKHSELPIIILTLPRYPYEKDAALVEKISGIRRIAMDTYNNG